MRGGKGRIQTSKEMPGEGRFRISIPSRAARIQLPRAKLSECHPHLNKATRVRKGHRGPWCTRCSLRTGTELKWGSLLVQGRGEESVWGINAFFHILCTCFSSDLCGQEKRYCRLCSVMTLGSTQPFSLFTFHWNDLQRTRRGQANIPKLQSSRQRVIKETEDITQILIITTGSHLPTAGCLTQKTPKTGWSRCLPPCAGSVSSIHETQAK